MSKRQAEGHLDGPRQIGLRGDDSEGAGGWSQIRRGELRTIGQVEGFGAVDEAQPFEDGERLAHREVPIVRGIESQVIELRREVTEVVGQLLARYRVETRGVERVTDIARI